MSCVFEPKKKEWSFWPSMFCLHNFAAVFKMGRYIAYRKLDVGTNSALDKHDSLTFIILQSLSIFCLFTGN